MQTLTGIAGLLLVGVLTPGPNNIVVMRQAGCAGWDGALRAIVGVVSGSVALLAVVALVGGATFAAMPQLAVAMAGGGCLYLSLLGARLIGGTLASGQAPAERPERGLPSSIIGLFVFQFLNPKAWLVIATAVASTQSSLGSAALPFLAVLLALISTAGLALWAAFGMLMMPYQGLPARRSWFDRAAGALLIGSALMLLVGS